MPAKPLVCQAATAGKIIFGQILIKSDKNVFTIDFFVCAWVWYEKYHPKKVFLLNLIFTGCSPTWMCQALPSLGCSQVSILCKLLLLCNLDYFQYLPCKYFRLPQMLECCPNPEPMMDHIHQLTDILFQDKCTTAGQFFILSSIFLHIVYSQVTSFPLFA